MLFEPFARDIARRFAGFEGTLLEVAAGTGRVTRALSEAIAQSARIVATDLNEAMLARAMGLVDGANIEWRQADGQALPFDDASFDAIVCQFGVMFFPDKAKGYAEARRMLKPSGRYVFNVWDSIVVNDMPRCALEALAMLFPEDSPDFMARIPHGYHDEATIRAALSDAGFDSVDIERVVLPTPAASAAHAARGFCLGTPMRAEIEQRAPDRLDVAVEAVTEALAKAFGDGPIAGTGRALIITAS